MALVLLVAGCRGGGEGAFTTKVPGNKPLGGLNGGEVDSLCADTNRFFSASTYRMDACRSAALAATTLAAVFSSTTTDADLQMTCSDIYSECLSSPAPGGTGLGGASSTGGMCSAPPANCTATVAELVACINDTATQSHQVASHVPDCAKLTRVGVVGSDGGSGSIATSAPASCQTYQSKCSGISDAAKMFIDHYCALIDSCCTAQNLRSQCASTVTSAATSGTYDETAGTACLDALTPGQAGPDFCGGLAAGTAPTNAWSFVRACDSVFQAHGTLPPGSVCTMNSDCAPGPNGGAICVPKSFIGIGQDRFTQVCEPTTANVLDGPCLGTVVTGFGVDGTTDPPAQGVFCEQKKGVFCDDATHLCEPVHGIGERCTDITNCGNVSSYCNFDTGKCEARRPIRAACTGHLLAECGGTAYCNGATMTCTPAGGKDAACSTTFTNPPDCLAGFCTNGTCPNPLSPICF